MLTKPLLGLALALSLAAPASAAQRLETIDAPSANVDPAHVKFNGANHPRVLRANVLLPDGYDGRRDFPVLFLLHGAGDSYAAWSEPERGDIRKTAAGLDAIVVMPEGATGFYMNWFNGGRRGDPGWERYDLDELIPLIERRYRVRPGRRWHAIAGLSMGGFGATYLASQAPGYFGSAATFSGFVQPQRPEAAPGLEAFSGVDFEAIFGPIDGPYATGHNPTRLTDNLRATRLYVTVGDGTAEPGVQSSPSAIAGGGAAEAELHQQADELVAAARASRVDVTYVQEQGVHDWPYWRRHLREAIAWGLFAPVQETATAWTYATIAQRGEAWGLRYAFAEPPPGVVTLRRDGERLVGEGAGTVTITNAAGCSFTAALPFAELVPSRICGRLRATVSPRRVRMGRRSRVRVRVTREVAGKRVVVEGARVVLGSRAVRTNAAGRATLSYRPRGRAGVRRVRVGVPGLGRVRVRLRVQSAR